MAEPTADGKDSKQKKTDFVVVAKEGDLDARARTVCEEFGYTYKRSDSVDELFEEANHPEGRLILVSALMDDKAAAAGIVQVAKQLFADAFIACVVSKRLNKESSSFVKKSGADMVMLEDEVYFTSKLEFVCTQTIKANFFPIKVNEVVPDAELDFDIYHFLPTRQKYLLCAHQGSSPSAEKLAKLAAVGEFYIKRGDIDKYKEYSNKVNSGNSGGNVERRCRAQYLSLRKNYSDLVLLLTDQSEFGSYDKGQALLNNCRALSKEILLSLGAIGSAWNVINNTKIGDFGSLERATAVAAYAGLFALQMGMQNVEDIMAATLLAELGLVFLHPGISKKIRDDRMSELVPEERVAYENYPFESLKVCLDRKLPIEGKLREVILSTHETTDGQGFPRKKIGGKVPLESQLIQFCDMLDKATLVKMGQARPDFVEERKKLVSFHATSLKFSPKLIEMLRGLQ